MVINLLPGLEVQCKSVVVRVSPSDNESMLKHKIAQQLLVEGQVIHKSYVIRIMDVCGNKSVLKNEETLGSLQVLFTNRHKYLIAYAIAGTELEMHARDRECIQLL
ncbi:hypothetical protein EV180_003323 [Coemansia sp. RSA 518]|nr:hypothetical protein LPJ54_004263 [Coemansia sp. RSA 1824]KAJ2185678.1 hypothetical protein EV181_003737 [Coemansia sp. RSA 532]KAJ2194972.1 hypothetical protein IW144_003687 [Coemansia sp. RSA 522]KAJ2204643.1 hypothetical protein IW145_003300 [Coemansia sp. RSA 521]KAJ2225620.1 hypothetical protein EV180_003323 [Coemansia sp. RSA 518]KAJ2271996.1 hypothetical protein J3F81_003239 [Coemansia sp. RSA 371]KAJ2294839.1 hypothetical protein IW141_000121 [Coemansia sp. RSA 355]